ncbi:hypothetical protein Pfo_007138 [Paulownia fortunei]|nr:hypothetical protein Pfo_007138 [Paulownia fortunei]
MAARLLSRLVLALCMLSVSADVFLSIDCGSSDSYKDENLINWTGDDGYKQNGESKVVQSSNSISHVMDTLRVFTTRNKNCYYIDSIRRGRVLVRASFYYGNYDEKSLPPTFDLLLDGQHWSTVETSSTDYVYYEVTYVMKRDTINVCVAQKKAGHLPFMSALEVRGLESYMYNNINENYPMFLMRRVAYGANATIRFTNDPYDRIWTRAAGGNGLTEVSGNAFFNGIAGLGDNPPPAVLQNAVTAINPNSSIQLFLGFPPVKIPVYLNVYFSEVTQLEPNQTRSFRVFKDNQPFSEPVKPPYGNFTELYASNLTVSSNTTFSLVPTNDSTLPPLINALELFLVGDALTDGTNSKDVEGLALLQNAFDVLRSWSGDPCLPAPYSWDWINCSSNSTPRVTALSLGSFGLSGVLPDFSSMDALETIDLHNNSLDGPIPDSLGALPNLKELNLADNHFSGSIPTSLSQKNGLNLVVTGNPDLCTSGNSCLTSRPTDSPRNSSGNKKKNKTLQIILGITIPSFIFISSGLLLELLSSYTTEENLLHKMQDKWEEPMGIREEL